VAVPLFDNKPRSDPGTARASESSYQFLDRVDDPVFARVRDLFNDWFASLAAHQSEEAARDMRGRLRSKQTLQFYGAFWELYLHEAFTRLGFDIESHPQSSKDTRPDFLLTREKERFYMEAVMPSPSTDEEEGPASVQTVTEYVDGARHPDFYLSLHSISAGQSTPKKAQVTKEVEAWLNTLEWCDWWTAPGSASSPALPRTELTVRDWKLEVSAIPRSPERRGLQVPMIAIYPAMGGFPSAVAKDVQPKLADKANRYGDLDAPYVIAVWFMATFASQQTAPEALFGYEVPTDVGTLALDLPPSTQRLPSLWSAKNERRGRVAAVLAAPSFDFNYSAVTKAMPRLWSNPWADRPFDIDTPFANSRVQADESAVTNTAAAVPPSELFDLPADWPGTPFAKLNAHQPA
jgi:hypothetical protein